MFEKNKEIIDLAAGVVIIKDKKILLVQENGKWGLPKGGHESGEAIYETAKREAKEETGLDIEIEKLAFITEFKEKKRRTLLTILLHWTCNWWYYNVGK